jgi:glucokinase
MDLGIDCGGTKTEAVVYDKERVVDHLIEPSGATKKVLFGIIRKCVKKYTIDFIGIGFPSAILNGAVTIVNNIPEWNNSNIEEEVTKKFSLPCKVENDAKCFALAEALSQDNLPYETVVGVTLGTGLGCGIIHNKNIVRGVTGAAGEINKIPYNKKTLEDYTSKKFFLSRYKQQPVDTFSRALLENKKEQKVIAEYAQHLAHMVTIIVTCIEPDCIVFGGNISNSFDQFIKPLQKELKKHIYPQTYENMVVKKSSVQFSACRGAALLKTQS